MNAVPEDLWTAYLAARFEVYLATGETLVLTVGEPAVGLNRYWLDASEGYIITAHNPLSQRLAAAENAEREALLVKRVNEDNYRFLRTAAVDVSSNAKEKWPDERGILLFGATLCTVLRLAAGFQQYAIVRVPRKGPIECLPVNA